MKKSFKKYEKAGLPGGPNELKRFTQGFIVSQRGQWDYPGLPTAVPTPSGRITMKGVEDNLLGIDNLGNSQYMTPGNDYQFKGDMVYEIPMGKKGGIKKPSKKYSKSLMSRNILFTKNPLLKKPKSVKNKIFDPNSPYFQDGGENEYNQLPDRYRYALQNFVYPNVSTDPNDYEEDDNGNLIPVIRSGYNALNNTITYDPNNPIENINNDWWREHELFHQLQTLAGGQNTSDAGMLLQKPNPYVASDEALASYYNRRESDVNNTIDKMIAQDPSLQFIPREKLAQSTYEEGMNEPGFVGAEDLQYADPSTLEGEARQYEQYIEAGNPSIFPKKAIGGFMELDLTEKEIQKYVDGGYIVEDISIPSLTRMDNGGNPIKQLQEKEKAAELSRLIASGAAGGLGNMANYITKAISESENKSKPSSNVSPARATAKPKSLAAVEKLASAPKTKPGEVNLAVRDFVQDAKEIDLKSKKDPYEEKNKIIYIDGDKMELKDPDADARYKQWVMNIEDRNKNQSYFEDFGDWINENIFGAESDIERAYKSTYNPVKPKTYYYNGRQVTGNGPWNNYGDAPVQMVYPEMFFMGPSGGAAGIAGNALKSGSKYAKNVIWPALNRALPLGEEITTATAGKITPFNIASLIFGSQSAANLANSDSESRKSLKKAYNNPTTSNILDAVGNVSYDVLGILGSPGVTNMFSSAVGGLGKLFTSSGEVVPNTEKLVKGLESVPAKARPTTEQFKSVIDKNIAYIKSPEYKTLRMQNTGETSAQVDKAVNSYVKRLNKTKLTSNKSNEFGTYTTGSLFSNPSINVDPYLMTPEKYLATFDHEIKHALSPFSGRGRYSLYKNYPILEGTPVYKEPSLKEIFFGNSKSPIAANRQYANYHALPYEQQVRALRLREKMKADLGISAETPLTEDDVYNWMSNYKYSLPEELGDVDDLLKQIKVGSADAEKTINVMEQPRNMANWMNKAWMFVPGAGVAGAAAYGTNNGANYKSGGLIEKKSSLLKADDGIEISDNSLFNDKLQEIADELGVTVDDLVGIMQHESRLNPSAVNPYTGAVGLIQFMPNTAKGLGTSIDALKQMSAVDQLDYVKKFYKPIAGKAKDIGDLYMYTFLPAAVGKPDDFVIGVKDSDSKVFGINQDALYKQNAVFDSEKKGYYTVGDVKKRISNFTGKSLTAPNRKKTIKRIPGKVEDTVKVIKRKHYVDSDKKEETIPVDPRIEQLAAFSKIMAPTSENIFQLYNQGMSSQMKYGGLTKMDNGGGIQGIEGLKEDFADRLSQFINDAKSQGINLKIGSGYRSYEKQKQLWEDALKKYGSAEVARKWVAPPGSSYHNKGLAVDLHDENSRALGKEENEEATAWAHANAKKYGLHFRMGNEPWHIEPIEFTGEDHEHTDENDITGDILIPDLQTESKVEYDDDYSDWSPNKKEVVASDPRLEQLKAFSEIIAPSSQNINMMYQNAIKGNMKKGGFIIEIDDRDIQKYLDGGYIVEEID